MAERVASLLVFGFVESGTFSTVIFILPNFPFASISCMFLFVLGSATTLTLVLLPPNPTRLRSADTLTFLGNNDTASFADPSKRTVDSEIFSGSISELSKNGAPSSEFVFFVVTSTTDSSSSFTAFNASRPAIAPDGRYTVLLKSLHASDITSKTD